LTNHHLLFCFEVEDTTYVNTCTIEDSWSVLKFQFQILVICSFYCLVFDEKLMQARRV